MFNNVDLYYIHLFNDFSGSPRVLRDAIDSEILNPENTFVMTSHHSGFLDGVNAKRVNCFYARSGNRYVQLFYFLLSQLTLFIQLASYLAVGFFQGRKSTVVINTMLPFGAGLAAKIMGAKVVYYVHETYITPKLFKRFLRFFIEHCASYVIFVSKYLQEVEAFNKPEQDVLYNGLRGDFPIISKVNSEYKFHQKTLFFAGSLKEYKGVYQLFEIANRLVDFHVVAAFNCEMQELKGLSIPSNVTAIARPDNIEQYFENSFAVLNLSLPDVCVETFGLSLIEGMMYGTPVVAPPIGGPIEFVHDKNGLLIDARETEKIADFLRYLSSSIDIWNSFSKQALLTSKQFTAKKYKNSFKQYLKVHNLV
jgi:glycosyltransferase involved in cell wall biosynthesis